MPSLRDKLRWRARFLLDGLTTHPRALLNPYFWKVLLRSSDRTWEERSFKRLLLLLYGLKNNVSGKVITLSCFYYGKILTLHLPWDLEKILSRDSFEIFLYDLSSLLLPYLSEQSKRIFTANLPPFEQLLFEFFFLDSSFNEGLYDTPSIHLEEGNYVIDVGANIGLFTVLAGKVVGEKGHIFAFEPQEEERKKLEELVKVNDLHNVTIIPKALGDKNTMVSMEGITVKEEGKGQIECITLDSWAEEVHLFRLDFLKMDVEGYERKVLLGGMKTLRRFKPKMGICIYHLPDDPEVLRELILQIDPEYKIQYNETGKKYIVGRKKSPNESKSICHHPSL